MTPLDPSSDPVAIGRFTLRALLGKGGMGRVYFGESPAGQLVAIKVIKDGFDDPAARERFADEVDAMKKVYGPNVAGLIDADPRAETPWLAMAYVPGSSLYQWVSGHGVLPAELVASLGALLVEGLRVIHQEGLLHRDLKPANIMLAPDGPKIIDFGLAVLAERKAKLTQTGVAVGTPICMAPEQIEAADPLTSAADVYALGVCLHFAAAGRFPYDDGNPLAVLYAIGNPESEPDLTGAPAVLQPLLSRMLAHDPGERPSLTEVATELLGIVADSGLTPNQARYQLVSATAADVELPDQSFPPAPAVPEQGAADTDEDDPRDGHPDPGTTDPSPPTLVWGAEQATLPMDGLPAFQETIFSGQSDAPLIPEGEPAPTGADGQGRPRRASTKATRTSRSTPAAGARNVARRLRAAYAQDAQF